MTDKKNTLLQTTDIYLVAALMSLGAQLHIDKIDTRDPKNVLFTLEKDDIDALHNSWINRGLQGNLYHYASLIRDVKVLVHKNADR